MALSKYEYVKSFERDDSALLNYWIVVRIDGKNFKAFVETHDLNSPSDENLLNLMNQCALKVMQDLPDIFLAYGQNDEFSFVFKRDTTLYNRRQSKLLSNICSLFTSSVVYFWSKFFPETKLIYPPEFVGEFFLFPENQNLIDYLRWRQEDCYIHCLYDTIFWALIKQQNLQPAEAKLKIGGKMSSEQTENNLKELCIDFNNISEIFKKGTILIRRKLMKNLNIHLIDVKNEKNKIYLIHMDIISDEFWYNISFLSSDNFSYTWPKEISFNFEFSYTKEFKSDTMAHPNSWIVIRIDGKCFHRFSDMHNFKKPNDERALNLMNKSALCVVKEIPDIILAYGESDEYSFVLKKTTLLFNRRQSDLLSAISSYFASCYVYYWNEFFPEIHLQKPPAFDARLVLYPTKKNLRDYLSWRQVDCHINNLYNTVFWALVQQANLTPSEAEAKLKGTMSADKNEILFSEFGINYNEEPEMFKKGTLFIRNELKDLKETNGTEINLEIECLHTDLINEKLWNNTCFTLSNSYIE